MLQRLERHRRFDSADRAAVVALPNSRARSARTSISSAKASRRKISACCARAFSHKIISDGQRQIVSIHMAGDMVSTQNALLKTADHNVQAPTEAEVALISGRAIVELATARPKVAIAMWFDTLIDGSIFREWIANVGRRDGRRPPISCGSSRCGRRAPAWPRYDLQMTQEQLSDALGLTPVHVNRTLKALEQVGLISRKRRSVTVSD